MSKELTNRQQEIFDFIRTVIHDSGFPPTIREIGNHFDITVKGAYDHLKAIEKKGFIRCSQNKSRAIELLVDAEDAEKGADFINIPLVGQIAAGVPILAEENIEEYLSFPRPSFHSGDYFALKVRGDSMIDEGIFDGDIAVLKKQNTANNGEIVAALIDDEATLKTFKRDGSRIMLLPANKDYEPIIPEAFEIVGKLAGLFRSYKNGR